MYFFTEVFPSLLQQKSLQTPEITLQEPPRPGKISQLRRFVRSACAGAALCALLLALASPSASSQVEQQLPPSLAPRTNNSPDRDSSYRKMTERMAKERNNERQKKIVADTAKLLAMAQKLNDEVSHSTKNELSVDVVKQAAEIEKLAKSIKEKMRDGY